ncbi:MAG: hypothetical protein CVU54_07810 [Deltaproteobacteria bacterium HGW-Deltaproteobacteria-12]|jgi:PAS domain S-box-containing protein|nr:MAG: hypothetical protein CVU54_07810 [Deltaproteobacteria bacterium HGW-Deltaproteobacteria-12]
MILDMRTLIFSQAVTNLICLLVITVLWQQNRKRFAGSTFLLFDFLLQTLAFFLVVLRGSIPDWMSMVLANTLIMAGALLGYMGLLRFTGQKGTQIHNYFLMAAFVGVHSYFTFVQPNLALRNANIALGLLIVCFQCMWLMLYRVPLGMRPLTRGVGIVFAMYCLVFIIRIGHSLTTRDSVTDFMQAGTFDALIIAAYQLIFIFLTFSLALMFNKRLMSEVKTQEEKFSRAFHSSPYALTITRLADGQIIEVNEGFFNTTGYSPADISDKTTIALHLWDRDEDRAAVVQELESKGKVRDREFSFRNKSGEKITGIFSADIITINNEKCVLSSINDITERKRAEEALRSSELKYRNIFENATEGIFQSTAEGRYISVNPAFARIGGYDSPEEMINSVNDIQKEMYVHQEDRARLLELCSQQDIINNFEAEIKRRDNAILWISINVKPVRDGSGKIILLEGTIVDITERKCAEEAIKKLNRELEQNVARRTGELRNTQLALLNLVDDLNATTRDISQVNEALTAANRELEAFSYSVSHDLRAPLRGMDGFSQALLEDYGDKLDATGKNYLERIRTGTQRMGLLIDDMLKLSRVNRSEFTRESVDLSKMLQSIFLAVRQNSKARNVQVNIQENVIIDGDRHLLEIALTNLLDNAWKFTGKTQNARIEFGTKFMDGKPVMFIRDNGVGFDMAYTDKLFGAFQRLHSTTEFPGTGIGLATVQRVIHRHGGRIWAESELGKGAVFYFTLP